MTGLHSAADFPFKALVTVDILVICKRLFTRLCHQTALLVEVRAEVPSDFAFHFIPSTRLERVVQCRWLDGMDGGMDGRVPQTCP